MILFKQSKQLADHLQSLCSKGATIGFVPTMGALHEGHISLVKHSLEETDKTVCSIFVNPTQFNDRNDFIKYPVSIEHDILLLASAGADILFLPDVNDIYPDGLTNLPQYELGELENILEGKYRPGHFQGVCQVMHRLLDLVQPHHLYMGEKDYQQCMVVKRLIEIIGSSALLHPGATLREADGLAMSSRNRRLSEEERKKAPLIAKSLQYIKNNLRPGELASLKQHARSLLDQQGFKVDYVEIADANNLMLINEWNGQTPLVTLIAAFIGDVRLIDNMK